MLGRLFRLAAEHGLRGLVAFSDLMLAPSRVSKIASLCARLRVSHRRFGARSAAAGCPRKLEGVGSGR
jgi:hypothetical protein